jgi:hypothetical protein
METRFYDFMAATSRDEVAEVPRHGGDETAGAGSSGQLCLSLNWQISKHWLGCQIIHAPSY